MPQIKSAKPARFHLRRSQPQSLIEIDRALDSVALGQEIRENVDRCIRDEQGLGVTGAAFLLRQAASI